MVQILKTALAAFLSTSLVAAAAQAQTATADDTAKFLAGLRPAADSPLAPLTQDRGWQAHADRFNGAFGRVDSRQLQPVRAWSRAKLTSPSPVGWTGSPRIGRRSSWRTGCSRSSRWRSGARS